MDDFLSGLPTPNALQAQADAGPLSRFGLGALGELVQQRRVFDQLDWWAPEEWAGSDAFIAFGQDHVAAGALLAVPVAFDDMNRLASSRSRCAWLRWCALADGASGSAAMQRLLAAAAAGWIQAGLKLVYAILEPERWIYTPLREAGFMRMDDVITLRTQIGRVDGIASRTAPARGLSFRPAGWSDLEAVEAIDASAFEEQWRFSMPVLVRAMGRAECFRVAELGGRPVGYCFATCHETEAHITRIAVHAACQRQGVGAALLSDALSSLVLKWGVRLVTLNTQASNLASRRLYRRFGFETVQPDLRVLCRGLNP